MCPSIPIGYDFVIKPSDLNRYAVCRKISPLGIYTERNMMAIKKNTPNPLFAVALVCFVLCQIAPANAEDGRIIKIETIKEGPTATLTIDPAELTLEKGDIAIWLNSIAGQEVNIRFQHENLPKTAITDIMGFSPDKDGAYAAKYLPFIATASLRFIEDGTYPYTVEMKNGKCTAGGAVTVRTIPLQ